MSQAALGSLILFLEAVFFFILQEPAFVPRLLLRMASNLPTSSVLRRYLTMTTTLWGKHIAGPILATIAIVLTVVAAIYAGNPDVSVRIVRYSAWITGISAACLIFVAQYGAWKCEREVAERAESKLEEIEKGKPKIKLKEPEAVYSEPVYQHFRDAQGTTLREQEVPFLKVRFINDPEESYPSANAKGVRAYIEYYRLPDEIHVLSLDGRWAESDQPSAYSQFSSKAHLLATTFGIGEAKSVDIAYCDPSGKYCAWNNDNYDYVNQFWMHPNHILEGERFRVEVRLRGDWIDKHVSLIFSAKDKGFLIESYDEEG